MEDSTTQKMSVGNSKWKGISRKRLNWRVSEMAISRPAHNPQPHERQTRANSAARAHANTRGHTHTLTHQCLCRG